MKPRFLRFALCFSAVLYLLPAIFIQPVSVDTTVGGTISTDTTWTLANSPYIVTSNITVIGTDGDDSITTLTIEAGVTVKFNSSRYIVIGAASGDPGALIAQGTETNPIVFTSSQASPTTGYWHSVVFLNTTDDTSTVMEYCELQYGGYYNRGQVYVFNASPTISNCTFSNSSNYDMYYYQTVGGTVANCTFNSGIYLLATSTVDFTGNTYNYNNSYPIKAYANDVGDIVYGNTFTNVDADSYLEVSADTIEHDATWTAGIPYVITGNIAVMGTDGDDNITTLTLQPGATLKFNSSCYLAIGGASGNPGALSASGTSAQPILFTSNQASPAPGDWNYIIFCDTTDDATTVMEHCVVEYGGGNAGALYAHHASPTFSNVTVQNSGTSGARLYYASEPVIENCTFSGNQNYDLFYSGTVGGTVTNSILNSGIYLLATGTVGFTGNTYNYNNSYPIKTYADYVGDIVYGNTFTNVDADSYLEVSADTIEHDATWTAGIPYVITGDITVMGTDGEDNITTLTIQPGATLKFNSSCEMNIGASSGNPGALSASGTSAQPVIFTSNQASPAPGDWNYILFQNTTDDATTVMEHCVVEYSGGNAGALYTYQASPTFSSVTVQNSGTNGARIYYASEPIIDNCTFTGNQNYDLVYYGTVGGTVSNCTFNSGINLLATSTVDFTGNTYNYNNSYPIKTYADYVGDIVYGNTFTNVDSDSYLEVSGDTIEHDATWTAGIPYVITGDITVMGTDGDDNITTLTIQPGATLKFNSSRYMNIGASSGNPGALIADGTETNPIVFTSNQTDPSPGDWYYIRFHNTTDDASTVMDYCEVQYAGYGNTGQVIIYNAAPTFSNCTFTDSNSYDLYYQTSGGGTVSNCTFNNGIYLLATSTVDFTGNTYNYNNSYPIKAYADNVGDIVYNNTFTNVDSASYLEVSADTIEHDATWTAGIPYAINGNIRVQGTDGTDAVTTLTIQPGATLKFNSSCSLAIGAASGNPGALIAQGTSENMILFTSKVSFR